MANINNNNREPNTAPQPDKWYDLTLGSSFSDHSPTKFCTLRYEFKPASIDKSQAGSLHKNKDNRVTVEFHNNQPGKPKLTFEGSSEDYKDTDGALFFDGHTFRLERLHRAVKRLRHLRLPGESAASSASIAGPVPSAGPSTESRSSPGHSVAKTAKPTSLNKTLLHSVPVEVERIDIGEPDSPGAKPTCRSSDYPAVQPAITSKYVEEPKKYESEENMDIIVDDDEGMIGHDAAPDPIDTDDEIADVDVSDDEVGKGTNAAEALRAQVNAEERDVQTSTSSGSSGSGSSGSGSGTASSSSDSEGSDDDSVSSGGDSQKIQV